MPSVSPATSYARSNSSSGTVIHIGVDTGGSESYSNTMPAQTASTKESTEWMNMTSSRPASRYSDRADSAASNISLNDKIDVFVEDQFFKSYNLGYEPVCIRIGSDAGNDISGKVYQSKPLVSGYGTTSTTPSSRTTTQSGYRESSRSSTRYDSPTLQQHQPSVVSVNGSSNSVDQFGSGKNIPVYSPVGREYSVPIARNTDSGNRQEYSVPIARDNSLGTRRGSVTIPITSNNDLHYAGRQNGVFSPDSGRDSVDLPISRLGYETTPLPATPIGRQSSVVFSPEPDREPIGSSRGSIPLGRQTSITFSPEPQRESRVSSRNDSGSRQQKSGAFRQSPSPEPSGGRQTVHFDAEPHVITSRQTGKQDPVSTKFSMDSGRVTPDSSSSSKPRSGILNNQPTRSSRLGPSTSTTPSRDFSSTPIGLSRQFSISKVDLPSHDNQALLNAPSLTYAVDPSSGIPPAPTADSHLSSRTRSLSRGDSTGRPSSRAGLPTYDRDYVDKSDYDSDLDDLADDERNERLRQKKLIFPQSRNAALMAELKQTTSNISATRRSRKENEFSRSLEKKEYSSMLDRFTAEQFVPQVPYYDEEGFPIAEYKRNFLAKQAANQARREFQARINNGEEMADVIQSPEWKRLFIDHAKEEYDGTPFKMGANNALQISLNKNHSPNKLQPWQLELKRLERFNE